MDQPRLRLPEPNYQRVRSRVSTSLLLSSLPPRSVLIMVQLCTTACMHSLRYELQPYYECFTSTCQLLKAIHDIFSLIFFSFDGGYVCGPDGKSECLIYIGVAGYCVTPDASEVDFTLTATLQPLGDNIFKMPQLDQTVAPQGVNQYQFCVDKSVDVMAQMKTFTSACDCPSTYANLEYVISRTNKKALITDRTWKIQRGQTTGIVKLLASDADTRPGTYYLNVLGTCTSAAECSDKCTCGPCANLAASKYGLYIDDSASLAAHSNSSLSIGSCSVVGIRGGLNGSCAAICPSGIVIASTSSPTDTQPTKTQLLSKGIVAGIVVLILVFLISIIGSCLYYHRRQLTFCDVSVPLSNLISSHLILTEKE